MPDYLFPSGLVMERGGEQWQIRILAFPEIISANPRVWNETHETIRQPTLRPRKERHRDEDKETLRSSWTIKNEAYAAIAELYPADRGNTEYDSDPEVGSYHKESGELRSDGQSPVHGRPSDDGLGLKDDEGLIENTTETFRKHGVPFDEEVLNIVVRESRENNGEDWEWGLSDKQYAVWNSAIYWAQVNAWACASETSLGPECEPISHRPTEWAVENLTDHDREDYGLLVGEENQTTAADGGPRIGGLQSTSTHPYRAYDLQRRQVADQALIVARKIIDGEVSVPDPEDVTADE